METGLGHNSKKGGNKSWELYVLQDLMKIVNSVNTLPPVGGFATESTLISVLNAVVASDQDIEILLVRDKGNADKVVQQIADYQTGIVVTSYKDVSGNAYIPTGPLEYLDPSAVLNLMLSESLAQGTVLDNIKLDTTKLDVFTSSLATSAKQLLDNHNVKINSSTEALTSTAGSLNVNITNPTTGLATEITLAAVNTKLTTAVRTHNTISSTGVGTVPIGTFRGSVMNIGNVAGVWNGISLPAGISLGWDVIGLRDTYGVINFDATGTTFIIEYTN